MAANDIIALLIGAVGGGTLAYFATRDDKSDFLQTTVKYDVDPVLLNRGVSENKADYNTLDPLHRLYMILAEMDLFNSSAIRVHQLNGALKRKLGSEGRPFISKPATYLQDKLQLESLTPMELFYLYLKMLGEFELSAMRVHSVTDSLKSRLGNESRPFTRTHATYLQETIRGHNLDGQIENNVNEARRVVGLGMAVVEHAKNGNIQDVDAVDVQESIIALEDYIAQARNVLGSLRSSIP
jgi:predicted DNA-binding protein